MMKDEDLDKSSMLKLARFPIRGFIPIRGSMSYAVLKNIAPRRAASSLGDAPKVIL